MAHDGPCARSSYHKQSELGHGETRYNGPYASLLYTVKSCVTYLPQDLVRMTASSLVCGPPNIPRGPSQPHTFISQSSGQICPFLPAVLQIVLRLPPLLSIGTSLSLPPPRWQASNARLRDCVCVVAWAWCLSKKICACQTSEDPARVMQIRKKSLHHETE